MNSSKRIRLGPFEVDLSTQELLRSGRRVRLQEQPFRILKILLERPGVVVTREELREAIWGGQVFVDFDRSLNTAVARLRETLGDSPNRPVYIETVPRKGYRLIAPVEARCDTREAPRLPGPSGPARHRRKLLLGLVGAGIVLIIVWGGSYERSPLEQESSDAATVPVRLTAYLGVETEPAFSPDGSQFAFIWNGERQDNFDLYVRTVTGGEPLRLTNHPNRDASPVWSPDGQWIAFGRLVDDRIYFYRISPLGGREEKLVVLPRPPAGAYGDSVHLAWAPDSRRLAIVGGSDDENTLNSIFLFDLSSGLRGSLTSAQRPVAPSFSPDGRFLAYADVSNGCFLLALSDSLEPAGEPRDLGLGDHCISPVWTPNGKRLVAQAGLPADTEGLWSVRVDGTDRQYLGVPVSDFSSLHPAVAAGGRLAFQLDLTRSAIWRLDLQTREARPLIASSGRNIDPVYSPDGRQILFGSSRGPVGVWIATADGSRPTLLVEGGRDARWSPDGRQVVFRALEPGNTSRYGTQNIWVIPAGGGPAKNLTQSPSYDAAPKWSRDGQWIYFISDRDNREQGRLWRMPSGGGEPQLLLNGSFGVDPYETEDGRWTYFSTIGGVSRVSREGDSEVVIDKIAGWSSYCLGNGGVYYRSFEPDSGYEIRFYRLEDRSTSVIYRINGPGGPGIDLSPDGRYLLFVKAESEQSDLMLLDGNDWSDMR